MSCGICAEVCPFDAIKMDKDFEIATDNRFDALLLNRDALAKPNSHFHAIRPTEASEVDTRLAETRRAAEAKAQILAARKAAAVHKNPTAEAPRTEADKPPSSDA